MGVPFKNMGGGKAVSATPKREIAQINPATDDAQVNGDPVDTVPDHDPEIPWPPAKAVTSTPFKL